MRHLHFLNFCSGDNSRKTAEVGFITLVPHFFSAIYSGVLHHHSIYNNQQSAFLGPLCTGQDSTDCFIGILIMVYYNPHITG